MNNGTKGSNKKPTRFMKQIKSNEPNRCEREFIENVDGIERNIEVITKYKSVKASKASQLLSNDGTQLNPT